MDLPLRKRRVLVVVAASIWLLWLANLAAMAWYYEFRASHPSYIPVLGSLTLLAIAGLLLLIGSLVRLIRGPHRSRALGWLLIGITPILIAATHLSVGAWILFHDRTQLSTPVKWASAAVASTADLVGRYRLPEQSSGERVMLFHAVGDKTGREMPMLDEHVVRMEGILGRQPDGTAHLFRGPVFSTTTVPGWYLCGVAAIESPDAKVGYIERHELAHAVIDRHCDSDAHPPSLLVEGWAESQGGYDSGFLAKRAWERQAHGCRLTLEALTSPTWYDIADQANYEFGGPLIDYILRTHGGPKFLELYQTCRPETFAADVKRVLGVTLAELDARYWDDIANQVMSAPSELEQMLADATLAEGVDRAQWQSFVREFGDVVRKPKRDVGPIIVEHEIVSFVGSYEREPLVERSEIIHAGNRHRWRYDTGDKQQVILATPEAPCEITKPAGAASWSISDWKSADRKPGNYWNNLAWIEIVDWTTSGDSNDFRMMLFREATYNDANKKTLRINRFEQRSTGADPAVVLEFEFGPPMEGELKVSARFEMYPERQWAIASYEVKRDHSDNSTVQTATYSYPADDASVARPVNTEHRIKGREHEYSRQAKLLRCEPWTVDETVFAPESLGIAQSEIDARYRTPWYFWCWGAMAPVTLLGGIALLLIGRNRPSADASASDTAANPEPAT
jgi:hypothetical protein